MCYHLFLLKNPCFSMVLHGFFHGVPWFFHGFPCVFHGFPWFFHGFPWVFHGFSMGFPWFFPWLPMVFHIYVSLKCAIHPWFSTPIGLQLCQVQLGFPELVVPFSVAGGGGAELVEFLLERG